MFVKITDNFAVDRDSILSVRTEYKGPRFVVIIKLQYTTDNYELGPYTTQQEAQNNLYELVRAINAVPKEN